MKLDLTLVTLAMCAGDCVTLAIVTVDDGLETVANSPEQFAAIIKTDMARMARVIKDAGRNHARNSGSTLF